MNMELIIFWGRNHHAAMLSLTGLQILKKQQSGRALPRWSSFLIS